MSSWKVIVAILSFAVLAIVAEYTWLRGHQQAQHIAWANGQVEQKIAAARVHLREQRWNEAIRELEDALEMEGATNCDMAYPVWEEARRGQAEMLLDAAGVALARRHPQDALRLLRAYLAHPQAVHSDHARRLCSDLVRALSDEEAAGLLARLSDEALTVFANKGQLTVDDGLHTEAAHALFQETLRRNLAEEGRKRETRREVARLTAERKTAERTRRIERLRDSRTYHSLSSFLNRTLEQFRDQQRLAAQQEVELRKFFQALGVNNAAEQEQLRADLLDRPTPAAVREQLERKRAEVKSAFRNETEYDRVDENLFDQLVDYEVDRLLKMLPSS